MTGVGRHGSAATGTWLGYYDDTTPEFSTHLWYDSPTDYCIAKTNYSLGSEVLVRGVEFDYRSYIETASGPHSAQISLMSDTGSMTITDTGMVASATWLTNQLYLGGPTYPVDNDPEIIFNCTSPEADGIRLASDTVTTVTHSYAAIYGEPWTLNNAEHIARLLYEPINTQVIGTPQTGTFTSTDNVDAYRIFLSSSMNYEFELTRTSGTGNFNMRLMVLDGLTDNALRSTSGSTFPKTFQYATANSATLLLMVDAVSFSDTGSYLLNVTSLGPNNFPPNVPVVNGPVNNSVVYSNHAVLNITVSDPENDLIDVLFNEEMGTPSVINMQFNLPSGSTVTYDWTGLSGGIYYWSALIADGVLDNTTGKLKFYVNNAGYNTAPSISSPSPANESSPLGPSVELSIMVYDLNGDAVSVSFYNASDDTLIGSTSVTGGLGEASVIWNGIANGQNCTWYAVASDPFASTTSPDWTFTTQSGAGNTAPMAPSLNAPSNGGVVPGPNVLLDVWVYDADSDPLTITFHDASDDSVIGTTTDSNGLGDVSVSWNGLAEGQLYSWYAIVADVFTSTSSTTWSFTTEGVANTAPSQPTLNAPANGATVPGPNVILNVNVLDADGDALTVKFYDASDDSVIGTLTDPDGAGSVSLSWNGLTAGQAYSWYVVVNDSIDATTSTTWSFSTQAAFVNTAPAQPTLNAPTNGSVESTANVILNVGVFDADSDALTVRFYDASDDSLIGTVSDSDGNGNVQVTWMHLLSNRNYTWYVTASDSINTTRSPTWSFERPYSTNSPPDTPVVLYPLNGAVIEIIPVNNQYYMNVTVSVQVFDVDGDIVIVTIYDAADDAYVSQMVYTGSGSGIVSIMVPIAFDTTYSWYVFASDGEYSERSDTFTFTIAPLPPGTVPGYSGALILVWVTLTIAAMGIRQRMKARAQ